MYLVIKNGDSKKSYQCTNTCNKPRVRVSGSYIPLTNNVQSKPKCKINSMEVASYRSYTYTGEQGTITTGTTYLTRTETTGTTYQTRASTSNTVYGTVTSGGTLSSLNYHGYGTYRIVQSGYAYNGHGGSDNYIVLLSTKAAAVKTWTADYFTISGITFKVYSSWNKQYEGGAIYTGYGDASIYQTSAYRGSAVTTGTTYQTRASTYNTLYGTRVSTSGTSYGTKTTNKTLTSSSWG